MLAKMLLAFSLAGFIVVGVLLLTNHWGAAIRVTNYIYLPLLISIYAQKQT